MKKGKNILVVTYWSINNALIHTYTLPYLRQIKDCLDKDAKIYLLTLSPPGTLSSKETSGFIESLSKENIVVINFNYYPFGFKMLFTLLFLFPYLILFSVFRNIKAIHAWCTPGGAIAWPISVLSGKPLVLDSFEPHAESMLETGAWNRKGFSFRVLFLLEKLQLKRASEVICATEGMIKHSQNLYGIKKQRYFVKPAGVDLELFNPGKHPKENPALGLQKNVCVYAGKFGDLYLENEVFDFFKAAYDHWKGEFSVILLTKHSEQEIQGFCEVSGFPYSHIHQHFVPHEKVPAYMNLAGFGICTIKPVPSKKYGTPIKNGEYWAMGLPLVIPANISVDSDIVKDKQIGYVLNNFSKAEYLKAIHEIERIMSSPGLTQKIRDVAEEKRSFKTSIPIYQTIYATNEVYSGGKE
ncbi:MAG: glycosyltransferase [Bacteroidia bacterium]|nr:glycosyltransferase [Bacteroidia bacterium]